METMELNIQNVLKYVFSVAPLFICFFLLMVSALNANTKGLVYLGFVMLIASVSVGLKQLFKLKPELYDPQNCQVFNWPSLISQYTAPDFNSVFLSFTFWYLVMPMIVKAAPPNTLLIIIVLVLMIGNGITRVTQKCNLILDIVIGNLVGTAFGIAMFYALWKGGGKNLLFIDSITSNNVTCNRPSKQTFKCAVYKNGQLISNL